jgi:cob(I)alamin adenosyltransferase
MTNNTGDDFGLVHVYTGDGKGKTTAAMGLALRALGNGNKVHIIQLMKAESRLSGELESISMLDGASFARFGGNLLRRQHASVDGIKAEIQKGLREAQIAIEEKKANMLILDEVNVAVSSGLADLGDVLKIVGMCRSSSIELVLTGRNAPSEIAAAADYVTSMQPLKHPYETEKIAARRGIEF